jgi:hypothetical protein
VLYTIGMSTLARRTISVDGSLRISDLAEWQSNSSGLAQTMDIDESKNEQFLSRTQAHEAYRALQRQLSETLSIVGTQAIESGRTIEVSGATKDLPPQPTRVVLSPGEDHYDLALRCARAFEMFKRA